MIDDDHKNAFDCAIYGIPTFLLKRPWNKGIVGEKIINVDNWGEIYERIKKMEVDNTKVYTSKGEEQ